jgi:hypothetical protein
MTVIRAGSGIASRVRLIRSRPLIGARITTSDTFFAATGRSFSAEVAREVAYYYVGDMDNYYPQQCGVCRRESF